MHRFISPNTKIHLIKVYYTYNCVYIYIFIYLLYTHLCTQELKLVETITDCIMTVRLQWDAEGKHEVKAIRSSFWCHDC